MSRVEEARAAASARAAGGSGVSEYAKRFQSGQVPEAEKPPTEVTDVSFSFAGDGSMEKVFTAALKELQQNAKDLRGRCVGRNADDAFVIVKGLEKLGEQWTALSAEMERQLQEARRSEREAVRAFIEAKAERDRFAGDDEKNRAVWFRAATSDRLGGPEDAAQVSAVAASTIAEMERLAEERMAELEALCAAKVAAAEDSAAQRVAEMDAAAEEALKNVEALAAARIAAQAEQVAVAEAAAADLAQKLAAAEDALYSADKDKDLLSRLKELEAEIQEVRRAQMAGGKEGNEGLLRELAESRGRAQLLEAELAQKALLAQQLEARAAEMEARAAAAGAARGGGEARAGAGALVAGGGGGDGDMRGAVQQGLSIVGNPALGGTLRVTSGVALSHATFQWYRLSPGSAGAEEPIAGATRHQYAPEPLDVGQMLVCSVIATPGEPAVMLVAPAPVANMEGLDASLQVLKAKPSAEFNVVVVQRNGEMQDRREVHQLEVLSNKVKLKRAGKTKYKEDYSPLMQVCGARGGGDAAAQGLFLALGPQLVFMLACESARQRNAAILLLRHYAKERGVVVLGPKDKV